MKSLSRSGQEFASKRETRSSSNLFDFLQALLKKGERNIFFMDAIETADDMSMGTPYFYAMVGCLTVKMEAG